MSTLIQAAAGGDYQNTPNAKYGECQRRIIAMSG
jgi:hypothetical protein